MSLSLFTIESNGGPLICLEAKLASLWQGNDALSVGDSAAGVTTDYDRACAIKGYSGIVGLKGAVALILWGMPLPTNIWRDKSGVTYLARWIYRELDNDVAATLSKATDLPFDDPRESLDFAIASSPMIVFDSACRSDEIGTITDSLTFELAPGRYRILTKEMNPDKNTSFILHKFCRIEETSS